MRRALEHAFSGVAAALAAVCVWCAISALQRPPSYQVLEAVMLSSGALLLVGAALSVWHRWKIRPVLTCLVGVLLTVYSLSVLLLGWEDVGGTTIALPLVLSMAFLAVLSFCVMFNR